MQYLGYVAQNGDTIGNYRVEHVSGVREMNAILQGSSQSDFKPGDFVVYSELKKGDHIFFVGETSWRKASRDETIDLRKKGRIKSIFYDTKVNAVVVTGVWNDPKVFQGTSDLYVQQQGMLNRSPLMYVVSKFNDPKAFFESFQREKGKIVTGNFRGLLGSIGRDPDSAIMLNILSGFTHSTRPGGRPRTTSRDRTQ